jgi:hypothetical protein
MKVDIVAGFELSNIHNIRQVDQDHFACEMIPEQPSMFKYPDHHGYWFCLRVEGAAGQRITLDIVNCDWMPSHWKRYRPVVTYTDPNSFDSNDWEIINSAKQFRKTFRFCHTYRENVAWVALRYPYTYSYHQNYLDTLKHVRCVSRETIHITKGGRNLDALTITDPSTPDSQKRKIVIYAREHAVEQEGSWVCQGAIDFLTSESPEAESLRKGAVMLIIPICAPDAAYHGRCTDPATGRLVTCDFQMRDYDEMIMEESRAIWNKVASIAAPGRIDLCLSLHSPHGWEENIWTNLHDSIRREEGKLLNDAIFPVAESTA